MDVPDRASEGEYQNQNAYQVYHKEGLLSQQSSVVPNAPLLYEQQVLLSKLRQGGSGSSVGDKLHKADTRTNASPPSPPLSEHHRDDFPHTLDSSSQDTDDPKEVGHFT